MSDSSNKLSLPSRASLFLPACMSLLAGIVDVTSWLTLGGLFAAHITGNLVVLAAGVVQRRPPHIAQLMAVPMFVLAVAIADIATRNQVVSRSRSISLLSVQTVLLFGTFLLSMLRANGISLTGADPLVEAMLAVSAMAVQNALLHLTQKKVPTTAVMTGNLVAATIAAIDLLRPGTRSIGKTNWEATWPLLVCFLLGCMVGAGLVEFAEKWVWLFPATISLLYVLWFSISGPSTEPEVAGLPT